MIAPVMVAIVGLGVYPKPLLNAIDPAVKDTNSVVRTHDPLPSRGAVCNVIGEPNPDSQTGACALTEHDLELLGSAGQ